MNFKQTFSNLVLIKLDKRNNSIKFKNGFDFLIDDTFDPEKHATVTGEIYGLPSRLSYTGKPNIGMPWLTDMELKMGDHVIIYYLSVIKAFSPETRRCVMEGEDRYIWIPYDKVFASYGEGFVRPVNGYVLMEPSEDLFVEEIRNRMKAVGLSYVPSGEKSNTNVSFGIVRYVGTPNREYVDEMNSDEGVDVKVGDKVILRKISDIPLQYSLHAKIDGGKPYWRTQRRNILARI
jgi:hypothetical protein